MAIISLISTKFGTHASMEASMSSVTDCHVADFEDEVEILFEEDVLWPVESVRQAWNVLNKAVGVGSYWSIPSLSTGIEDH